MNGFLLILSGNVGAVAHLGERVVRNDEVASSILVSSTNMREITPISSILLKKITNLNRRYFLIPYKRFNN